jgi:2-polyprenyl-3-methyl-5-hydroxy-6-metoxy-1,4-benzoquinol methylase
MESDRIRWNEKHAAKQGNWVPDLFFVKHSHLLQPGLTLDLACGKGRHALWLASHGHQVTAADISDIAISMLRKKAEDEGLSIHLMCTDLEVPEGLFSENQFHNVVCINYRPADSVLTMIAKWIRPGGHFLWCSFNEIQASNAGFPQHLALMYRAHLDLEELQCLIYERFEDHTGHRDGYVFKKREQ